MALTETPETLTAVARAEQLKHLPPDKGAKSITSLTKMSLDKKSYTDHVRRAMERTQLPQDSASKDLDPRSDVDGSLTILRTDDIEPYDKNPRKSPNPRRAELKESIKVQGITNPITVTRRPGGAKYFPFGGGNTRLELAKELRTELGEEGERRFGTMQVIIKAWPGEAAVIAAHLAENNVRGDTTFWDNAGGVMQFKREWEAEHTQTITGSDLNQQLRLAGINYGVKMVQNFVFAVERMAPIGPWLRSKEVNETIRPTLSSYFDLAERLDAATQATNQFQKVLQAHALDLTAIAKRNQDAGENTPVVIDTDRLVREATDAIANGLDMPVARMKVLADAFQARPSMTVKELRDLDTSVPPTQSRQSGGGSLDLPSNPRSREGTGQTPRPPEQAPLGPLLGVVGGTHSQVQAGGSRQFEIPGTQQQHQQQDGGTSERDKLIALLSQINAIVPIDDFVLEVPMMPFGYFVDLPEQHLEYQDAALTNLRESMWFLLAACTGQTQQSVYMAVRDDPTIAASRYGQALERGTEELITAIRDSISPDFRMAFFSYRILDGRLLFEFFPSNGAIWSLMSHPQLGPLLLRVLAMLQRIDRQLFPASQLELPHWEIPPTPEFKQRLGI